MADDLKIVLVDDSNVALAQLEHIIGNVQGAEVVGRVCDGAAVIRAVAELKPDLVLLMFSSNDIEPKMWIFQKRSSWLVGMGQRSYAVSLLFKLKQDLASRLSSSQPLIQQSSYAEGHPRWENIDSSMTELNQLTRSQGIPLVVFARTDSDKPWDLLGQVAQREGFPLRSLRPFNDERWEGLDPRAYLAKGGGLHANGEGLARFATLIYEELELLDVLTPKQSKLERAR